MDKYKEALNKAKKLMETSVAFDRFTIEHIFPELKESEDERIKKELIGFLRNIPNSHYTCEEMAAWLEKQGEQKPTDKVEPKFNIGDIICDKSCTTLNKDAQPNMEIIDIKNGMYICDKGSFPVSQQDEYELVSKKIDTKLNDGSVSNELREASFAHARKEMMSTTCPNNMTFEFAYNFEEGAKWQAAQKPTWSEEDEEILNLIIKRLQSHADVDLEEYSKEYDWLNSPKVRSAWKPSDEQMKELNYAVSAMASSRFARENDCCYNVLKTLRDQLKKLK